MCDHLSQISDKTVQKMSKFTAINKEGRYTVINFSTIGKYLDIQSKLKLPSSLNYQLYLHKTLSFAICLYETFTLLYFLYNLSLI